MLPRSHDTRSSPDRRGLTLVEVLVSVAVVAALASVLLPALGNARSAAQQAAATSIQRQLQTGTSVYMEYHDGFIPGINTTGMRFTRALRDNPDLINQFSDMPTQDVDWITPSAIEAGLPESRAARMFAIFERFADPALGREADLYEGSTDGGLPEMQAWLASRGGPRLTAVSYLMPISFQLYGGSGAYTSSGPGQYHYTRYGQYTPRFVPQTEDAIIDGSFVPRLTEIGAPDMKIANATGLRYYNDGNRITTNVAHEPTRVGSFATWGAMYSGSESYGQPLPPTSGQDRNETDGQQARLVYRHRGRIIAVFFDGHAETLGVKASQNPSLWYPRGSTMGLEGTSIVEHAFSFVDERARIP